MSCEECLIIMICALYIEARPFVKALGLKPIKGWTRHRVFRRDHWVLGVSGPGQMNAAILTTRLLERFSRKGLIVVINLGISGVTPHGATNLEGEKGPFLCHTVGGECEKMRFHPHCFIGHGLKEASVLTVARPVSSPGAELDTWDLVDMEAFSVLMASRHYVDPFRAHVLKIASDHLSPHKVTPEAVETSVETAIEAVVGFSSGLRQWVLENRDYFPQDPFVPIPSPLESAQFSETMRSELRSLLRYASLNKVPRSRVMDHFAFLFSDDCKKVPKTRLKKAVGDLREMLQKTPLGLKG